VTPVVQAAPAQPAETFTMPPVISAPMAPIQSGSVNTTPFTNIPSPEDTTSPEPGWLTPKVFKGTSLG
jgi:hypothetical protein